VRGSGTLLEICVRIAPLTVLTRRPRDKSSIFPECCPYIAVSRPLGIYGSKQQHPAGASRLRKARTPDKPSLQEPIRQRGGGTFLPPDYFSLPGSTVWVTRSIGVYRMRRERGNWRGNRGRGEGRRVLGYRGYYPCIHSRFAFCLWANKKSRWGWQPQEPIKPFLISLSTQ